MTSDIAKELTTDFEDLKVSEDDDQLIIGLDFGTTLSGIAYTFLDTDKPDLCSILDWPGLEGHKQPKVPSIISYDPKDKKSFTWGGQRHKFERVEGIKLLLDQGQETPIYILSSNTAAELRRLGKPAVDVAADYIAAIYKHALSRIEPKMPADYLKLCQKKFVVSVPAVWSDKAKDTTLRAAKQANIHPVHLIKEPEAAALYTLHVLQDKALSVGDAFVICDAGGETVDLISYEISALSPNLDLKQLVPGKGRMAGSLGLNKRFEQAIKEVVSEDQFFHLWKTKGFEEAMLQFERAIKTAFRGDPEEEFFVNFPMAQLQDDPENNILGSCWNMKGDDLKRIFTPLITDIQRLVDDQVNLVKVKRMTDNHPKANEIKAIFLVGGFGSSEYLKQCLQEKHPNIQVIQPIVKGAVLSQLPHEASITSTVATRHYGVCASCLISEKEDELQPKVYDRFLNQNRVRKMTWYIYAGEDLQRDQKIPFPFFRTFDEAYLRDELITSATLIQCEAMNPPKYPKDGVTTVNCVLTADLTSVDSSFFKRKTSWDRKSYYEIHYNLVVTLQAAQMRFSLEIDGVEMGSVSAKYD